MVIPCELVLLLERLFGYKINGVITPPPLKDRLEIFAEALKYIERYPHLSDYICNHWAIVVEENTPAYLIAAE